MGQQGGSSDLIVLPWTTSKFTSPHLQKWMKFLPADWSSPSGVERSRFQTHPSVVRQIWNGPAEEVFQFDCPGSDHMQAQQSASEGVDSELTGPLPADSPSAAHVDVTITTQENALLVLIACSLPPAWSSQALSAVKDLPHAINLLGVGLLQNICTLSLVVQGCSIGRCPDLL